MQLNTRDKMLIIADEDNHFSDKKKIKTEKIEKIENIVKREKNNKQYGQFINYRKRWTFR